jgi:hypothetical protein
MNKIEDEPDSVGESCQVSHHGEYLFIDIKQEHCSAPVSPAGPVLKNDDQVRMVR